MPPASPLAASPPRVLVVEDDLTVSEVVTRYLERKGFVVEVAYDGAVAWSGRWPIRPSWWCSTS